MHRRAGRIESAPTFPCICRTVHSWRENAPDVFFSDFHSPTVDYSPWACHLHRPNKTKKAGASNNTQILRIITGSGFQSTGLCECRSVFRIYNPGNTPGSFRLTSSPSRAANACFACILDSSANHPLQLALYHYSHENSTLFTLLLSLIIYVSSPKNIKKDSLTTCACACASALSPTCWRCI